MQNNEMEFHNHVMGAIKSSNKELYDLLCQVYYNEHPDNTNRDPDINYNNIMAQIDSAKAISLVLQFNSFGLSMLNLNINDTSISQEDRIKYKIIQLINSGEISCKYIWQRIRDAH